MKKTFALLITALLLVTAISGCADNTSDESKDVSQVSNFEASKNISVLSREQGSGTRGAFIELFGVEQKDDAGNKIDKTIKTASINNSTGIVLTNVAGDQYAIGYISLGSLNDTVKAVKIDGVEATVANINNGTYKISRPFNIATKDELSEVAEDFVKFILSKEGQAVVTDKGYIEVANTGAFTTSKPSGKVVVAGSSSVTPVMEKLKEAYEKINTNANIEIQQSDSTTGVNGAVDGICDIGMASRELKDSELAKGIKATVIALDGIAIIVNKSNTIDNLTVEQVRNIYTGVSKKWADVIG
ncbi:MAG: phosphate ABC transporter substrate-binding protein [Firmicutes bacterium HGW-Firmicutes-21]|nr:MAG: phosphate ABC transporter substrate-binding protein [Firmicutes bacterium HGW-Firmicutes-21]